MDGCGDVGEVEARAERAVHPVVERSGGGISGDGERGHGTGLSAVAVSTATKVAVEAGPGVKAAGWGHGWYLVGT